MPFYTQWSESRWELIAYYVAHCTTGDVLIGMAALILALILNGAGERVSWPAVIGRIPDAGVAVDRCRSGTAVAMGRGAFGRVELGSTKRS